MLIEEGLKNPLWGVCSSNFLLVGIVLDSDKMTRLFSHLPPTECLTLKNMKYLTLSINQKRNFYECFLNGWYGNILNWS